MVIVAAEDIPKYTELTYDYGKDYTFDDDVRFCLGWGRGDRVCWGCFQKLCLAYACNVPSRAQQAQYACLLAASTTPLQDRRTKVLHTV